MDALVTSANCTIPCVANNSMKHWWSDELDDLKNRSIDSHRIWVTANKPRSGAIFEIYKQDKYAYKLKIRKSREEKELDISNDLHDALCCRDNSSFWKILNSKFNSSKNNMGHKMVGGLVDPDEISDAFSNYFRDICKPNSSDKNMLLRCKFEHRFVNYVGDFLTSDTFFTVELISKMICELKMGKAPGCDGLVTEHLLNCHPSAHLLITYLCNPMLLSG